MIYVDTSVALAHILVEDKVPPESLWQEPLMSSRLLEYEAWTRLHARRLGASRGEEMRAVLARISFIELAPPVLLRALEPFPAAVRTLDALHLASMEFLRSSGQTLRVASYDRRLLAAARAMRFAIFDL